MLCSPDDLPLRVRRVLGTSNVWYGCKMITSCIATPGWRCSSNFSQSEQKQHMQEADRGQSSLLYNPWLYEEGAFLYIAVDS